MVYLIGNWKVNMSIDFKKELNKEQYLAATSTAKHLKIIAGAGTGKTRTLTYRLANMIMRGDFFPGQIVAITFTNKVAREMRERVDHILLENNLDMVGRPIIMTFHGFCYRFLRRELCRHYTNFKEPFSIADEKEQSDIFKRIAKNEGWSYKDKVFQDIKKAILAMKTKGITPDQASERNIAEEKIKSFYESYQEELARANALDFDDLLMFTYEILRRDKECQAEYQRKFKAFLIDEFQDTNLLQYKIVKKFMNDETELCVVGDPDQTIYTWRGADNDIIKKELNKDFPDLETVVLNLNYRSTQKILDKANQLIKNNNDRVDKSLVAFSDEKGADVEFLRALDQDNEAKNIALKIKNFHNAKGVRYSDIAVIYRSNYLSRVFEKNFNLFKIPYQLYGGIKFYERAEVKAGLAYLRLLNNPDDSLSFEKVIHAPSIKIGDITLEKLRKQADEKGKSIFRFIKENSDELTVSSYQRMGLARIVSAMNQAEENLKKSEKNIDKIILAIKDYFNDTGFYSFVKKWDENEKEDQDKAYSREDNIKELIGAVHDYLINASQNPIDDEQPTLNDFLINVALESDQDTMNEEDKVAVMTGHVSKGLEFPYVFVTGLVDGILPSSHAQESGKKGMEEERRLFYVAMTRAKKYLCISTFSGSRFGGTSNLPSHFLKEIGFESSLRDIYSRRTDVFNDEFSNYGRGFATGTFDYRARKKRAKRVDYVPTQLTKLKKTVVSQKSPSVVKYKVGDKIAHASYGIGVITKVVGARLYVDFDKEVGQKILIAGFKAFKKI